MAFCAICGTDHSPDYPCSGLTGAMLNDMGVERHSRMSKGEYKTLEKKADRYMLKFFLIAVIGFFLLFVIINLFY